MLKKLLPVVLLLVGLCGGGAAGHFLRPPPVESEAPKEEGSEEKAEAADAKTPKKSDEAEKKEETNPEVEYVKLSNQFVVPIVRDEIVTNMVVMSLSIEVPAGTKDAVFRREPKLRDAFLQVLFDHANVGGFDGAFTTASNLSVLRAALREVAQKTMSADAIKDVLILEIARQDY